MAGSQRFKLDVAGIKGLERALRSNSAQMLEKVAAEMSGAGAELMGVARAGVPVESGELRDSAFVPAGRVERARATVSPGYTSELAPAVHEGFHGKRKFRKIPSAHWFSRALKAYAPGFKAWVANACRRALGGS